MASEQEQVIESCELLTDEQLQPMHDAIKDLVAIRHLRGSWNFLVGKRWFTVTWVPNDALTDQLQPSKPRSLDS
jgi:hypothetical protein